MLVGAAKSKRVLPALAILLSGCAVGPNYQKPQTWTPPEWKVAQAGSNGSVTVPDAPDVNWWNVFHDPELTSLEKRVATQNLDVQRGTAQLAESRAQLVLAGAERFPALSASGSYARAQYSSQSLRTIISHIGQSTGGGIAQLLDGSSNATIPLLDRWRDGVDATWEVDLWGRVRRQYEAAQAYLNESTEQRRSLLIAREADLARDYMTLRGTQQQLDILKRNRDDAQHVLDLSSSRYQHGLVSELDQEEARSELDAIQAQIPQMEQEAKLEINAVSLLMGSPPGSLDAELSAPTTGLQPVPPRVPVGLPSELAERRPDIRAASDELHAATAEVGQAIADFYPRVTIDASFGMQSFSFRDLGFWSARAWNVGPTITLPIFQGGRLSGQLELKKASQKGAAIQYRKTVLSAWKDVDDALTSFTKDGQRKDELEAKKVADQRAYDLALERYRHGLDSFLRVLDAERRLFQSEQSLTAQVEQESVDVVRLYAALGGGWESVF
ncbi:efflux transporter outer membrane subunit [Acetobacter conturbans]|uniref:Efflux transporter outer membrane subunit n=1 Tax=Acetobacter conturbans TaxID=1737472 RepID=A0ABX0K5R3_9PROT|nr:efflux transporter outer membrane subunit [Acetobacter conturbans]NHN89703.1 efflux transporter outer membrane subunit [Acetobacter conturbans]